MNNMTISSLCISVVYTEVLKLLRSKPLKINICRCGEKGSNTFPRILPLKEQGVLFSNTSYFLLQSRGRETHGALRRATHFQVVITKLEVSHNSYFHFLQDAGNPADSAHCRVHTPQQEVKCIRRKAPLPLQRPNLMDDTAAFPLPFMRRIETRALWLECHNTTIWEPLVYYIMAKTGNLKLEKQMDCTLESFSSYYKVTL